MKIHYLTLDLVIKVTWNIAQFTLYIMWPLHLQRLKLLRATVNKQIHLQENTVFDLDLGTKVTQDVALQPLHHVTYAFGKFDVATSDG